MPKIEVNLSVPLYRKLLTIAQFDEDDPADVAVVALENGLTWQYDDMVKYVMSEGLGGKETEAKARLHEARILAMKLASQST